MTDRDDALHPDDAFYGDLFGVLDQPADPDPEFAARLEELLIGQRNPDRVRPPIAADDSARRRFWILPAAALLLTAVVGAVLVGGRDNQRTVTGPVTADDMATTSPAVTSSSAARSTGLSAQDPESNPIPRTQLAGVLPDGTDYRLLFEPARIVEVRGISGAVVIDIDGGANAIGVTNFRPAGFDEATGVTVDGRTLIASSGGWVMEVALYEHVVAAIAQIDQDIEAVLVDSIRATGRSTPGFDVVEPFRWADDVELPLAMEIDYGDFVVRRGCGELAISCSSRAGAQVIPADRVFAPSSPWGGGDVWIDSLAPRQATDPTWLDPGPLQPRGGHQVAWTGTEMIVWGGATGDRPPHLTDGAAFNPETNQWRLLPPSPFAESELTVAVWADSSLLVVAQDRTAAYDPDSNAWEVVGEGVRPGMPVWTGADVAMVSTQGVFRFDRADGQWRELEGAFATNGTDQSFDQWTGESLLAVDGDLYIRRGCSTVVRQWTGSEWETLPALPQSIAISTEFFFCPMSNQWAGASGSVLLWESDEQPTVAYDPKTRSWTEIARIPVDGTEGPPGGVALDDRVLAGGSAIYDPSTGQWVEVVLPGSASRPDLVWTGSEVLMWGGTCCYGSANTKFSIDAWRWTPPN